MDDEWRPIESAPKDGTVILVCRHMGEWGWVRGTAYWEDVRGISGWISRGLREPIGNLGLAAPSHWRPYPSPPALPAEKVM